MRLYYHYVMELIGYGRGSAERLDATFAALADPTRRAILARLASGDASVIELASPFAMSQPAISKHLKVLERAGLISRSRDAQRRPCRLEAKPLAEASGWLERYRAGGKATSRDSMPCSTSSKAMQSILNAPKGGGDKPRCLRKRNPSLRSRPRATARS